MAGIVAYGAYIPVHRLGQETAGWGSSVEKAVRGFDEDSVSMAVAAARDCLKGADCASIDGVVFASTTPAYMEKQSAAIVAEANDLRSDIFTTDCTGSLRAGTSALRIALDAVNAGSARNVLVVAADCRMGAPKGDFDRSSGDGAVALLVGDSDVVATIDDVFSVSDQIIDLWRGEGEQFVGSWEDRFVYDEGYFRVMPLAVSGLLRKAGAEAKDFTKAVLYGPNARRQGEMARRLGFDVKTQLQDPLFGKMGCTGCAFALMLLVGALEEASAGDKYLMASYGDGSDAMTLTVTDQISKLAPRRGIKGHLSTKRVVPDYLEYVTRWRGLMASEAARRPPAMPPSPSARHREEDQNIRLYAGKCKVCGTTQYPPQRVCTRCHSKDQFDTVNLSGKTAQIFTFSQDYLAGTADVPLVITVVDFDGGGRGMFMMTDRDTTADVYAGAAVEMTFRKLRSVGGIHNYYWKTMPPREKIGVKEG